MKNLITKKIILLIALSSINYGVFAQQIVADVTKTNDQQLVQRFLQAIQKSTDIDSFMNEFKKIARDSKIKNDEDLKNFFLTQKISTPEFENITLYEYAKKSGKKYITDTIDLITFYLLFRDNFKSKNFDPLKELINQPWFNVNLSVIHEDPSSHESYAVGPLEQIFDNAILVNDQVPLEIIDLLLEKGASLKTMSIYENQSQLWQIALNKLKYAEEGLQEQQKRIAELTAKLKLAKDDQAKKSLHEAIEYEKSDRFGLKGQLDYIKNLIALIKKHAQKLGETQILNGIAEYEKTLKAV